MTYNPPTDNTDNVTELDLPAPVFFKRNHSDTDVLRVFRRAQKMFRDVFTKEMREAIAGVTMEWTDKRTDTKSQRAVTHDVLTGKIRSASPNQHRWAISLVEMTQVLFGARAAVKSSQYSDWCDLLDPIEDGWLNEKFVNMSLSEMKTGDVRRARATLGEARKLELAQRETENTGNTETTDDTTNGEADTVDIDTTDGAELTETDPAKVLETV